MPHFLPWLSQAHALKEKSALLLIYYTVIRYLLLLIIIWGGGLDGSCWCTGKLLIYVVYPVTGHFLGFS